MAADEITYMPYRHTVKSQMQSCKYVSPVSADDDYRLQAHKRAHTHIRMPVSAF